MLSEEKSFEVYHLRNEFNIFENHGIHEYFGSLAKKGFMLTLQVTRSIHDSMNRPNIEFTFYGKVTTDTNNHNSCMTKRIFSNNLNICH